MTAEDRTERKTWRPEWAALRVGRDRIFYKRQGIEFHGTIAPFGVEGRVTGLMRDDLTRDHFLTCSTSADFVGTTRGFSVQLYAVSRPAAEAITAPGLGGVSIDRDSPAAHSIGRLTPRAITFESASVRGFQRRKQNVRRAVTSEIARRFAESAPVPVLAAGASPVDLRPMVIVWARSVMGDVVWGPDLSSGQIDYVSTQGRQASTEFRVALHDTFRRVRRYSGRPWLRVLPSLSRLPVTAESRRLNRNIRVLREYATTNLPQVPEGYAARALSDLNEHDGIDPAATLDDVLTCYLAGIDTLTATIIATLWQMLHPANTRWRDAVCEASGAERMEIAQACVKEALRLNPPGSAFNNRVRRDVEIRVGNRGYRLRNGTRVMPHVHAIHAHSGPGFNPSAFLSSDARPYFLSFGRGARSCPGRPAGLVLAATYLSEFLRSNHTTRVSEPTENPARFNTTSDHPLRVVVG